jgi:hypothetical protein
MIGSSIDGRKIDRMRIVVAMMPKMMLLRLIFSTSPFLNNKYIKIGTTNPEIPIMGRGPAYRSPSLEGGFIGAPRSSAIKKP